MTICDRCPTQVAEPWTRCSECCHQELMGLLAETENLLSVSLLQDPAIQTWMAQVDASLRGDN